MGKVNACVLLALMLLTISSICVVKVHASTASALIDMCFVDELNGWAVGAYGIIVHTSDGGLTWNIQDLSYLGDDLDFTLYGVDFIDLSNGWAVGSMRYYYTYPSNWTRIGVVIHTSDGGETWSIQQQDQEYVWGDVDFVDVNNGWVVSNNGAGWKPNYQVILHTSDGGATWELQGEHYGVIYVGKLFSVQFLNTSYGWICGTGEWYNMMKTTDGGATWNNFYFVGNDHWILDFDFVDVNNGWACSDNNIYSTIDGGETWVLNKTTNTYNVNSIDFFNSTFGYACGGTLIWKFDGDWILDYKGYDYLYVHMLNVGDEWFICGGEDGPIIDGEGTTLAMIAKEENSWDILLGLHQNYKAYLNNTEYIIYTECDSTLTDLTYNNSTKELSFKVFGPPETFGYAYIHTPKELFEGAPIVLFDDTYLQSSTEETETEYVIYITYPHSAHNVRMYKVNPDLNLDGVIDVFDLVIVAADFGRPVDPPLPIQDLQADINKDAVVDIFDIVIVANEWDFS